MSERTKLLFICARNRIRSVAAETLFRNSSKHEARSAGINNDARVKLTAGLIGWADKIFVMEKSHQERMVRKFRQELRGKDLACLFIPDEYEPMEEALLDILRSRLGPYLDEAESDEA